MITDAIFAFFAHAFSGLLGLVPVPSAPDLGPTVDATSGLWNDAAWLNNYLPVSEALAYALVILAAWVSNYFFRAVLWGLTKAHVLGGA